MKTPSLRGRSHFYVEMRGNEPLSATASPISSTDVGFSCYCQRGRENEPPLTIYVLKLAPSRHKH